VSASPLRLMWAGFLSIFVWGSIAGLLGSVLPSLRERAALSLAESGWLFVALSTGLVAASLLAGFLLDAIGRKQVLSAAVALVVLALVALEFWNALPLLLLLAFLLGAGGSALVTAAHALIADLNPQHRAAALNLLDFFFGVGAFVTPSLIVPLQRTRGLTGVLFALAGLATLVLVYLSTVAIPRPKHAREFSASDAARLLRSGQFWVPAAIIFLYGGTEQSVWDWQVTYFMRQLQIDNIEAARVLSIFPIAIMLGRLGHNFLLRKVPAQPVLIVSAVGAAACFALMLTTHDARAASLGLFVAGLFMASVFPTTLGVLAGRFPESSGTALGLAITGGWLGSVAISPSFGFVAHRSDFWTAYLVVVASATLMVVAAVALWRQGPAAPHALAGAKTAAAAESL
jgi:fucose permease